MASLNPWQLLLWIAAVTMILVPLIGILFTTIINGYFRAKESFLYRTASNFSKAFERALKAWINEMEERKKNAKRKADDSHPNS